MRKCPYCGWPCRGKECPEHRGLDRTLREVYDPPVLSEQTPKLEAAPAAREREA